LFREAFIVLARSSQQGSDRGAGQEASMTESGLSQHLAELDAPGRAQDNTVSATAGQRADRPKAPKLPEESMSGEVFVFHV
jgi:hypothetical protein